ncbi:MAG TPA: glycosyltransferase family 87 protein [Candidatus Binatia bacterium]|nr:glycosyltransferase family 87 protein [Candidatus Binatia bacterium]
MFPLQSDPGSDSAAALALQADRGGLAARILLALRRLAIGVLLAVNLAGGIYRYAHPYETGENHVVWDLKGGVRITRACDPMLLGATPPPHECRAAVPYLPGGFVFFRWLGVLPWDLVAAAWLAISLPVTFLLYRRTILHLARGPDPASPRARAVILGSLVAFKGTSLALYSGNFSLIATWLLGYAAIHELLRRRGWEWHVALCLALAATKPSLAAPFFLYLLLAGDLRAFGLACAATIAIHVPASFAYLGPLRHLEILTMGLNTVETYHLNASALLGASGRVDLRPLLESLGLASRAVAAVLASLFAAATGALVWYRRRTGDRLLLLNCNLLFFAPMYHRDYDIPLLMLIAMPLLWKHRRRFGMAMALVALPAVLPLQFLYAAGMQRAPDLTMLWNAVGTSMIISVLGIGAWLNWCELSPRRRGDPGPAAIPGRSSP